MGVLWETGASWAEGNSCNLCAIAAQSIGGDLAETSAVGLATRPGLGSSQRGKKEISEPGIEPGDSRWQRLMLPLHHSERTYFLGALFEAFAIFGKYRSIYIKLTD